MAEKSLVRGDHVRMTEDHKKRLRANKCAAHVKEFGSCVGIVEGPVDFGLQKGPEVDVRWQPSNMRFAYHPKELDKVESKWSVKTEKLTKNSYRTVFTVGVQSFVLHRSELDEEARVSCEFIGTMFLVALANIGVHGARRKADLALAKLPLTSKAVKKRPGSRARGGRK